MSRSLVFCLLGFVLLTLLGPLQHLFHMDMAILDAPLVIVLYLAMAGRATGLGWTRMRLSPSGIDWAGALTAVLLGYISDVLGGGIKGLHCFTMALLFLVAHRAARHVYLTGVVPIVLVTFGASVTASIVGLSVRWFAGIPPGIGSLKVLLAQAVLCAMFAPFLMRLCRIIDARLLRARVAADR